MNLQITRPDETEAFSGRVFLMAYGNAVHNEDDP